MCTAVYLGGEHPAFGRNLDLDHHYSECIAVAPRGFIVSRDVCGRRSGRRDENVIRAKYAITGVAEVRESYPLYYDAVNERGLCAAGLNFPKSASYGKWTDGMINLAPHELIPYVLSQCENLAEAKEVLMRVNLTDTSPEEGLGTARLHFMLADKEGALTAEPMGGRLMLYENSVGALTNEPPFDFHLRNLSLYRHLSPCGGEQNICQKERLALGELSGGLGAVGLPGDLSSPSRFIRAAFGLLNTPRAASGGDAVLSVFDILGTVSEIAGVSKTDKGFHKTVYTSVADLNTGTLFIKTFGNYRICAYRACEADMEREGISVYPIEWENDIKYIIDKA